MSDRSTVIGGEIAKIFDSLLGLFKTRIWHRIADSIFLRIPIAPLELDYAKHLQAL